MPVWVDKANSTVTTDMHFMGWVSPGTHLLGLQSGSKAPIVGYVY